MAGRRQGHQIPNQGMSTSHRRERLFETTPNHCWAHAVAKMSKKQTKREQKQRWSGSSSVRSRLPCSAEVKRQLSWQPYAREQTRGHLRYRGWGRKSAALVLASWGCFHQSIWEQNSKQQGGCSRKKTPAVVDFHFSLFLLRLVRNESAAIYIQVVVTFTFLTDLNGPFA